MVVVSNDEGGGGLPAAIASLLRGAGGLDAVEAGIKLIEADESIRSVGRGGAPNLLGNVECDAAIMDGVTLQTGAVGALQGYLHAISVARAVMERLPHVMLVGQGAARFASEIGSVSADMLTSEAQAAYRAWVRRRVPPERRKGWRRGPLAEYAWPVARDRSGGTVVFLALDQEGRCAAGASTSGWAYKYPGRLGDTPMIGAGIYADTRAGACGCTHTGEMTIRCATAHSVVLAMRRGATVEEACHDAAEELDALRGGFTGPVVLHAIDRNGQHYALTVGGNSGLDYWVWVPGMENAERRRSDHKGGMKGAGA